MSDLTKGALLVITSALFFSTKAIFVKLAYRYGIETVTLMTLRMLFSLPFYLGVLIWQRQQSRHSPLSLKLLGQISLAGVLGYYFASYFDLLGLNYISASFERLILYLFPLMVLMLSAIFLKTSISKTEWGAVVLGYLGILLIFVNDVGVLGSDLVKGTVSVLFGALAYAVFIVGSSVLIPRVGSVRFTAVAMTMASLTVFSHFILANSFTDLLVSPPVLVLSFLIAILSTVIPTFLMSSGIQRVGANRAALMGAIGPVATMIMAVLVLDEVLSGAMIIGMIMVIASVTVVSLMKSHKTEIKDI